MSQSDAAPQSAGADEQEIVEIFRDGIERYRYRCPNDRID